MDFIKDSYIIMHNSTLDLNLLNYELSLEGMEEIPRYRTIDTLAMARHVYAG